MADIKEIILRSQIAQAPVAKPQPSGSSQSVNFDSLLQDAELKISKHAQKRLNHRQLEFDSIHQAKLKSAVETLEKKGARDSLVLMGELAFIVNVPSKTVVTAMSKDQMNEHVFTNIDSTILVTPEDN